MRPFLTVWIEWLAHKFGIQLPVSPPAPFLVCAEMYSSVCVSHSSRQVGRLTKVKMLYSMRQEKHRNTEYRRRHTKPRRLFNVHLLRCTPRTWTGRRQAGDRTEGLQLSSCSGLPHMWRCKTLTVRNTDASRSPTEKIRPLLLSLIWKRTWSQPINTNNNNITNLQQGQKTTLLSALLVG